MKGNSGRLTAACRAHRRTGQRRNKSEHKMMSSPELDIAGVGWGWKRGSTVVLPLPVT